MSSSLADLRQAFFGDADDELAALLAAQSAGISIGHLLSVAGDALTNAEETLPRSQCSLTNIAGPGTGIVLFNYFTARYSRTPSNFVIRSGGTAAAAITLGRIGLYVVESNGDLTLQQAAANDTAFMTGANTTYTKAITTPVATVRGQRYAVGILHVGTTMPTHCGPGNVLGTTLSSSYEPRICARSAGGQTDLPASVAVGTLQASSARVWTALT